MHDQVAVGDPRGLLARRPDIRAAERRLASHQAQIGEQMAGYFPKLSLLGNIGFASTSPGQLLEGKSLSLIGVPYLSWDLLDFGRTKARVNQAQAARDDYAAQYAQAVLTALRDANTALSRFGHQRETVRNLMGQEASSTRNLGLVQQRRDAGTVSLIDLLDARCDQTAAHQRTVSAQADLLKDFVSLQKSLGLGWQAVGG